MDPSLSLQLRLLIAVAGWCKTVHQHQPHMRQRDAMFGQERWQAKELPGCHAMRPRVC